MNQKIKHNIMVLLISLSIAGTAMANDLTEIQYENRTEKNIYGLIETVQLDDFNHTKIKAKLDTGAVTTSLGATEIEYFNQEGKKFVRFKPQIKGQETNWIEKPLIRVSKIKVRSGDSDSKTHTERPVVMMDLCMNGKLYLVEVNLTDRSRFSYPLLIGSTALIQMNAIVDPSQQLTVSNYCYQEQDKVGE